MNYKNNLLKLIDFDKSFLKICKGYQFIGIDEVGRGALAGPVIACAFSWKKNLNKIASDYSSKLQILNDSKQLNSKQRNQIYKILVNAGNFAVGYASVQEIEKLNILNATFLAMKRAFEKLILSCEQIDSNQYILVDGNKFNPYINCRQIPIIGGDTKSSLIAGASVIAKVYRDCLMHRLSKSNKYKCFGWNKNVGYGTAHHCMAIKKYGLTPIHRKLFVRKILAKPASFVKDLLL